MDYRNRCNGDLVCVCVYIVMLFAFVNGFRGVIVGPQSFGVAIEDADRLSRRALLFVDRTGP